MALAATGGRGPLRWTLDGPLPEGLSFDPASGVLQGTPSEGNAPAAGPGRPRQRRRRTIATQPARLLVYQSDQPLVTPAWWKPGLPPVPWRAWLDQGVGFLVLWLVHWSAWGPLNHMERSASIQAAAFETAARQPLCLGTATLVYRMLIRLCTASAMVALVSLAADDPLSVPIGLQAESRRRLEPAGAS